MTGESKPIVWLIDEIQSELRTYNALLRRTLPTSMVIEPVVARKNREDYEDILGNPRTAAIILDQRLKSTGISTYTGIELARYFRSINSKLPIYILTNYAADVQEFLGSEWSVEDILAKDDLKDESKKQIIAARFIRRLDVYDDILVGREQRFRDLLSRSLRHELNDAEIQELENLQLQRFSATLASELTRLEELDQIIDAQKKILSKLSETLDEEV